MRRPTSSDPDRDRDWVPASIAGVLGLLVWEVFVRLLHIPPFVLPAPSAVAVALVTEAGTLAPHAAVTLGVTLGGFVAAVLLALGIAYLIDRYGLVRQVAYPYLVVSQTIPLVFVYPLLVIWFGYGLAPRILIVILVCFFPVALAAAEALASSDPDLIDLFATFGASRWTVFRRAKFPAALPVIFAGLKTSATYSVMGAVIAEWLGASRGLGVYMLRAYKSFAVARVFAAIVLVVILSLVIFQFVNILERLAMPWRRVGQVHRPEKRS